jgi:hypothetical protein
MNNFQQFIQIFTSLIDDFSQNLNNFFNHPGNDDEIEADNSQRRNTNENSRNSNNVFIEISQSYEETVPGYRNTITIPNCFSNDVESFLSNPSIYLDQITDVELSESYFLLTNGNLATREFINRDIIAYGNPSNGNKPLIDFAFNNFLVNNSQKLNLPQETINLYKEKISQQKSLLQDKYSDLVEMSELSFEKKEEFKNKISAFFNACLKYGSKNFDGEYISFHHLFQKELDELIRDDVSENNTREESIEDSSIISNGINNLIESVESGTNSLIENNKQLIGADIADSLKTFVSDTSKDTRKIITGASRSVNDIIKAFNDNTDFEQGPSSRPSPVKKGLVSKMTKMFENLGCSRQ